MSLTVYGERWASRGTELSFALTQRAPVSPSAPSSSMDPSSRAVIESKSACLRGTIHGLKVRGQILLDLQSVKISVSKA